MIFFHLGEIEIKKAKKAFLDSIDQYCIHMLEETLGQENKESSQSKPLKRGDWEK